MFSFKMNISLIIQIFFLTQDVRILDKVSNTQDKVSWVSLVCLHYISFYIQSF